MGLVQLATEFFQVFNTLNYRKIKSPSDKVLATFMELMHVTPHKTKPREKPIPAQEMDSIAEPDFKTLPSLIEEFVELPDFPRCALGKHLNIGGSTGVLVQIINQSIKIKTIEGTMQSFNTVRLKRLYGRPLSQETLRQGMTDSLPSAQKVGAQSKVTALKRETLPTPDFNREPKPVSMFAARPDFPKCVFGEFLEIGGYTGVVVEIINRSLKVRSQDGATRSYNEEALRKLFGSSSTTTSR